MSQVFACTPSQEILKPARLRPTGFEVDRDAVLDEPVTPPSKLLLALEGYGLWEPLTWPLVLPGLLSRAPKGDGHSVVFLPGLLASDLTTLPMRAVFSALGYHTVGWGQGRNRGSGPGVIEGLRNQLRALNAASGRRVSLVGRSLGGLYAREMARLEPELVRCVITLGSPLYGDPSRNTNAWSIYEVLSGQTADGAMADRGDEPPPVPTTSIYSRDDGIVDWRASVEKSGLDCANVEVRGSHLGLAWRADALYAIADRLSQPDRHEPTRQEPQPLDQSLV